MTCSVMFTIFFNNIINFSDRNILFFEIIYSMFEYFFIFIFVESYNSFSELFWFSVFLNSFLSKNIKSNIWFDRIQSALSNKKELGS